MILYPNGYKLLNEKVKARKWGELHLKYDMKTKNRLKRIEGQIRGIMRMMEEGKDCRDVVTQLSAVRSAVDRTIGVIVSDNLLECINNSKEEDVDELVQEAINLIVKSR